MVNKGVTLDDIKEVHSHPMALLQCNRYLDHQQWKQVATEDTALSARNIKELGLKHTAAIAGITAAALYELDIVAADIHDQEHNYTRLLVLNRREDATVPIPGADITLSLTLNLTGRLSSTMRSTQLKHTPIP